jgi:hypothetical protein
MLKRAEMVHRSIWERRDEAKDLSKRDEWVLENGHQLGLVLAELAELKKSGKYQLSLAEI